MFVLSTAGGRKLFYVTPLLKGQQDKPYRTCWQLSQEDSSSWDQFTIKLSEKDSSKQSHTLGKPHNSQVSPDSGQGTTSTSLVPCALILPLVTKRTETRNSHPSTAKQLKALLEILPTPRFPHIARAAPVRVTIYISNPPGTSADAQL